MIRLATPGDAPAIAAIWNRVIRDTVVTFTTVEKNAADLALSIGGGTPFHVAVAGTGSDVLGFVTASQFRSGPGYAHTFEHSVHVAEVAQGQGYGRALMAAIEEDLRSRGVHSLFAGVSGENVAGAAFHHAVGYRETARLTEVGFKSGRWHDLILMQKML